jgi:hypothetical protein
MTGLCLGVAFSVISASLPVQTFTLAWTHSIEKTRWEEDYRIEDDNLVLQVARIRGSGAGMEPPEDAVLRKGHYEYRPVNVRLTNLRIARSPFVAEYQLCWSGGCSELSELVAPSDSGTTDLFPCRFKDGL